jgi:hypothetical protein
MAERVSSRIEKVRIVRRQAVEQLTDLLVAAHDGRADLLAERDTITRLIDVVQAADIAEEFEEDRLA